MQDGTTVHHTPRFVEPHSTTNNDWKVLTAQKEGTRREGDEKEAEESHHSVGSLVWSMPTPPPNPCSNDRTNEKKFRMTMSLTTTDIVPSPEWPSSSYNHRSRSRLRCIPCGRCHAVIQHDSHAPWSVVNKLVNMHWNECPGSPHVPLAHVSPPLSEAPPPLASLAPSSPLPTPARESGSTNRSLSKKGGGGGREFAGPTRTGSSITSAGWERKRKTEEQRKKELEEDEYAENVTATSVTCIGCRKPISLDKRSRYYPGLWIKHKNKCPDVDRLKVRADKCRPRCMG